MVNQDRYQRGWERLKEIDGEAGERVIDNLRDIAPDFARYLIEFPFGDIYSRPGLDSNPARLASLQHSLHSANAGNAGRAVVIQLPANYLHFN